MSGAVRFEFALPERKEMKMDFRRVLRDPPALPDNSHWLIIGQSCPELREGLSQQSPV